MSDTTRAERERRAYDKEGVFDSSDNWHRRFPHVFSSPNSIRYEQLFEESIRKKIVGGRGLEIGCGDGVTAARISYLGPSYVLGLDISEAFITKAKMREIPRRLEFRRQDAMIQRNGSFDVIYGRSVLHHVDYAEGLKNLFSHNLNPGGSMVFMEPLGSNPLIKLYHFLSGSAHTPDEKPFDRKELRWFKDNFPAVRILPFNFVSFFAGLITHFFFKRPDNIILRLADALDERLARRSEFLAPYFRHCVIIIEKP